MSKIWSNVFSISNVYLQYDLFFEKYFDRLHNYTMVEAPSIL